MYRKRDIEGIIDPLSRWTTTGIEPSRHGQDNKNAQLNILARILTDPKDTCIALCLWEKNLLIASNQKFPRTAEKDLNNWWKFICRQIDGLELLKITFGKSKVITGGIKKKIFLELESEDQKTFAEFHQLLGKRLTKAEEQRIQVLVEKLFSLSKNLRGKRNFVLANDIWECISLIEDTNKMMEIISKGSLDQLLIDAISNNNLISLWSEDDIHAEMKIIDYILGTSQKKGHFYIGIGKLCCLPCQKVIDVLNEDGQYHIGVPGTHGKTYRNWNLLKIFEDNSNYNSKYEKFRRELTRISKGEYSQQIRETTCHFPEKLATFGFERSVVTQQVKTSTSSSFF